MILPNTEMYFYRHPVDMRKQVNGLIGIVSGEMQLDPTSSALFVFIGKSGNKLKMLQYEKMVFGFFIATCSGKGLSGQSNGLKMMC